MLLLLSNHREILLYYLNWIDKSHNISLYHEFSNQFELFVL